MSKLFAIYDLKARFFGSPVIFRSKDEAVRSVVDIMSRHDVDNMICVHPEDFSLFEVGEYDNQSGVITPCAPVQVFSGVEFLSMGGDDKHESR